MIVPLIFAGVMMTDFTVPLHEIRVDDQGIVISCGGTPLIAPDVCAQVLATGSGEVTVGSDAYKRSADPLVDTPAAPNTVSATTTSNPGTINVAGVGPGKVLYRPRDQGGFCAALTQGAAPDVTATFEKCTVDGTGVYQWEAGAWRKFEVQTENKPADPKQGDEDPGVSDRPDTAFSAASCRGHLDYNASRDICVWANTDGTVDYRLPPFLTDQVLPPSQNIRVVAVYPKTYSISISTSGTRGLFEPSERNEVDDPQAKAQAGGALALPPVYTSESFAARLPGEADITITVTPKGGEASDAATRTIELTVERAYSGAIRLGIAVVLSNPERTDRKYSATTLPGSRQSEIVVSEQGVADFELVLGYAPYVFDMFPRTGPRGRLYHDRDNRGRTFGFAPYVGLGLLEVEQNAVQFLKSLHLGLEWEAMSSFSIAATLALRRVTRLDDKFKVGQAHSGDVPTRQRVVPAFGLVLNLSPAFFKIARRSGSTFYGGGGG